MCRAEKIADVEYEQRTAEARARRAAKDVVVIDSDSVSSGSDAPHILFWRPATLLDLLLCDMTCLDSHIVVFPGLLSPRDKALAIDVKRREGARWMWSIAMLELNGMGKRPLTRYVMSSRTVALVLYRTSSAKLYILLILRELLCCPCAALKKEKAKQSAAAERAQQKKNAL